MHQRVKQALVLLLFVVFGLLVWPTPYAHYGTYKDGFVRVNRLTRTAELLTRDGWMPLRPNPFEAVVTGQPADSAQRASDARP